MPATTVKVYLPDALPNGMIGLQTKEGEILRKQAAVVNELMIDRFSPQVNRTLCGPASLALLMNSLNLAYHIKYQEIQTNPEEDILWRVTEDDIVNSPPIKTYLRNIDIGKMGLTLTQLAAVTMHAHLGVNTYFMDSENSSLSSSGKRELFQREKQGDEYIIRSVNEFREFAVDYIGRPVTGIIVNYDMSKLGYEGLGGHFSPLAAYNTETDRFLVMDVWPDTPPAWVKTDDLFKAMVTVDKQSGLPRGFLHIHELL